MAKYFLDRKVLVALVLEMLQETRVKNLVYSVPSLSAIVWDETAGSETAVVAGNQGRNFI